MGIDDFTTLSFNLFISFICGQPTTLAVCVFINNAFSFIIFIFIDVVLTFLLREAPLTFLVKSVYYSKLF